MNNSYAFAQTSNKRVKEISIMKTKRIFLALMLTCTVLCAAGCGRRMNSATDGTDKNNTTMEDNTNKKPENDNVVDGVMDGVEDTVDGVMDGVNDVIDGTEHTVDDTVNDGNVNENVLPDNQDNTVNDQNNVNDNNR